MKRMFFALVAVCGMAACSAPVQSMLGADGAENADEWNPTASDYIQDGILAMWDGIENAGWGVHVSEGKWIDLIGGLESINIGYFDENSLVKESLLGAVGSFEFTNDKKFNSLASKPWTIEVVLIDGGYSNSTYTHSIQWLAKDSENVNHTVFQSHVWQIDNKYKNQDNRYFANINANIFLGLWTKNEEGAWIREIGQTYDGEQIVAYKGGISVHVEHGQIPYSTEDINLPYSLRIYNTGSVFHYYALRIYDRALSPKEIEYNNIIDKMRFGL